MSLQSIFLTCMAFSKHVIGGACTVHEDRAKIIRLMKPLSHSLELLLMYTLDVQLKWKLDPEERVRKRENK